MILKTILNNQSNTNFFLFKVTCFSPEIDTHEDKTQLFQQSISTFLKSLSEEKQRCNL
jgi:hypothetical protein